MKHLDDNKLVDLFLSGSSEAIETLISRYKDKLTSYIRGYVKESNIVDDLYQDTMIKVVDILSTNRYNKEGKFLAWLMRVTHNVIIDYFRVKKSQRTCVVETSEEWEKICGQDLSYQAEQMAKQAESEHDNVRKLICKLPAEQCEVLVLRYYMGMNSREIAEHLDVNLNTILGRIRYGISNLRKMIEQQKPQQKNLPMEKLVRKAM